MTSEEEKARQRPKPLEVIPGSVVVIAVDINSAITKGMRGIVLDRKTWAEEAVLVSLENNKTRFFYDFEIVVID